MAQGKKWYYAVFKGHRPGIYEKWEGTDGALAQVDEFAGAKFKKFKTQNQAQQWLNNLKDESEPKPPSKKNRKKAKNKSEKTLKKKVSISLDKPEGKRDDKNASAKYKRKKIKKKPEKTHTPLKKPHNLKNLAEITIYTDGACTNNPGPGGYGVVLIYENYIKELSGGFRLTTNNRMEITACIEGLRSLKKPCAVTLFSDSKYVVNAMEKGWVKKWRANDWKRNERENALNVDLWEQMLELCQIHDVAFNWVKGHAGNQFNERCDQLATQALCRPDLPSDTNYEQSKNKCTSYLKCPECGAPMILRNGKYEKFYGCSRFPKCKAVQPASRD